MRRDPFTIFLILTMAALFVLVIVLVALGALNGQHCVSAGKTIICHDR